MLLLVVAAAIASSDRHHDLHRAVRHHSSLNTHREHIGHSDHWIVKPVRPASDSPQTLVDTLNRLLTGGGSLHVDRITRTALWVLEATPNTNGDQLSALLMSEQRAGMIEWFHRDSYARRQSH